MDELANHINRNIAGHGWHAQYVEGDVIWPRFTYSIGWGITRDWPEVIVVGQRLEVAHAMLSSIWQSGNRPKHLDNRPDIIPGFTCQFRKVDISWYEFAFGRALDAYMSRDLPPFEAIQCIWPTTSGVFPWDPNAPDGFDRVQPLIDTLMLREPGK